ncbi:MAG: flagellar biosynthesis protein FlhB [Spirochaetota bacterium]|nr:flagellar biosynthesis protein FlhB [Spirochaetota bacterium]
MIDKKIFKQFIFNELEENIYFIDLQLFAKPEDEGRTEEPSVYKQRKAREEGKVARSQELISSLVLIAAFITIWLTGEFIMNHSKNLFKSTFSKMDMPFTPGNVGHFLTNAIWELFYIISPILLVSVFIAFISNVLQVGFMFTTKSMKMDFKKISFTANKMFSKIFFSRQTMVNLLKSVLKVGIVVFVAYLIFNWKKGEVINSINMDISLAFSTLTKVSFYIGGMSCFIFLVLSIPDYYYQKIEHKETLKMSRHEVKEERKDTEGDPYVKQRLRERQRELMSRRMMDEVPKADVVITNPTHFAIAIKYDSDSMIAPIVVAKGQGYIALKIKEIAITHKVHLVENKPLAQSLYSAVEIGDQIPEEFYQAIAEILAFVIRAKESIKG